MNLAADPSTDHAVWPYALPREVLLARFLAKVEKDECTGCWNWIAGKQSKGYGSIGVGDHKTDNAHRVAWILFRGPIPDGFEVDHLCRRHECVNPSHLEPVPQRVNALRGVSSPAENARKASCASGHPLSGRNLIQRRDGRRNCRECSNAAKRAYWQRTAARRAS